METSRTQAQVDHQARNKKLAPKITDFIGRKGFTHRVEQETRSDGTVKNVDVVSWKPNENGKPTRQAEEVNEARRAHRAAELERAVELAGHRATEAMSDGGGTRYVPPHLAAQSAERNGWSHRWMRGKRKPASLAASQACPHCGFNVNLGRCKCAEVKMPTRGRR